MAPLYKYIETKGGNNSSWMDGRAVGNKDDAGSGTDFVWTGTCEKIAAIKGPRSGGDTYEVRHTSLFSQNYTTTTFICFFERTAIKTAQVQGRGETQRPGDPVGAQGRGIWPLRSIKDFAVKTDVTQSRDSTCPAVWGAPLSGRSSERGSAGIAKATPASALVYARCQVFLRKEDLDSQAELEIAGEGNLPANRLQWIPKL